jgi:hypothetical protein
MRGSRKRRGYMPFAQNVVSHHGCICLLRYLARWQAKSQAQFLVVSATAAAKSRD